MNSSNAQGPGLSLQQLLAKSKEAPVVVVPTAVEQQPHSTVTLEPTPAADNTTTYPPNTIESLQAALETLRANLDNPHLVSTSIAHVMTTLRSNPNFVSQLRPEDGRDLVRGLQNSYTVVKRAKEKTTASRGKSKVAAAEMKTLLGDINFGEKK